MAEQLPKPPLTSSADCYALALVGNSQLRPESDEDYIDDLDLESEHGLQHYLQTGMWDKAEHLIVTDEEREELKLAKA